MKMFFACMCPTPLKHAATEAKCASINSRVYCKPVAQPGFNDGTKNRQVLEDTQESTDVTCDCTGQIVPWAA